MKNRIHPFKTLSFVFLLSISFTFKSNAQSNGFEVLKSMELMDLIFQQLETSYVDDIQPGEMTKSRRLSNNFGEPEHIYWKYHVERTRSLHRLLS